MRSGSDQALSERERMNARRLFYLLGFGLLLVLAPLGYQVSRLAIALPVLDGEVALPGLVSPAEVTFDSLGIPAVTAGDPADAYRILGYLHARDRLFQMDLLRRKTAGTLAEILGAKAVAMDRSQRLYPFGQVARTVVAGVSPEQRRILESYAEGVNTVLKQSVELGLEFRVLHYRPEPWRPEDSILVALSMFQTLNGFEKDERMLTVMDNTLPPAVTAFLTPDTDDYAQTLIGGSESRHPATPVPLEHYARSSNLAVAATAVQSEPPAIGSNNWAVAGSRTADGRAIIANDMHLPLNAPNIWYRAELHYQERMLAGVTLPGLPMVLVGTNGHLAWGFTNVDADLLDLVRIESDPAHPDRYLTPEGYQPYTVREEHITVKDAPAETLRVQETVWGPVSPTPLQGHAVAIHWASLQPETINLKLLELDAAGTLEQALSVFNRAGAPPQNVVLADQQGKIAWTYTGFIPVRTGFDGRVSVSWAKPGIGWHGYIPPDRLPRLIDPPDGFIATANNRTLGKDYPYVVSHAFSHSYRAYRIRSVLSHRTSLSETDLLNLQLDTVSEFYEFYRQLALDIFQRDTDKTDPDLKQAVTNWDGRMDTASVGIGVLVTWRQILAEKLFAPLIAPSVVASSDFAYSWREQETPLRALLKAQVTPSGETGAAWSRFMQETLQEAARKLRSTEQVQSLATLTWGQINRVTISHPFSLSQKILAPLLDMPTDAAGACNTFCVKVLQDRLGASERLVISPGHLEDGLFEMPGGQSGHPLSPHYRDQQTAWLKGSAQPFLPGPPKHRLHLRPDAQPAS